MQIATEKKIGWISGAVLILSELLLWMSPKLGWDVLKTPENSWISFLSGVFYFWFLFQIWNRGKPGYKKYLWLMFLSEAVYNVATFKLSSFVTLPFYSAVGLGMLLFLPRYVASEAPRKIGWAKKAAFAGFAAVLGVFTVLTIMMPPYHFLPESNIPGKIHQSLQRSLNLGKQERIRYFMTDGTFSFEESFIVLTDKNIHIVQKDNAVPYLIIPFADIAGVESDIQESFWATDEITLRKTDGEEHKLFLLNPSKQSKRELVEKILAMTDFKSKI